MIGAAVLAVGLLLILTGIASVWVPGEAMFASPGSASAEGPGSNAAARSLMLTGSARRTILAFVLSPIHSATWRANAAIGLGFFIGLASFTALVSVFSAGFPLLFAGFGVLFIALGIEGSRIVARIERWRAMLADRTPLRAHPYRPLAGGLRELVMAEFGDPSRWRDVLYVAINLPLAILEFAITVAVWTLALSLLTAPLWFDASPAASLPAYLGWLSGHSAPIVTLRALAGFVLVPVAASVSQVVMALQRAVITGLLGTSESRELQRRVETLQESRSAVLDVEASELRRIERDLHDGAQQRLVMLTIDLSLASERIDSDPEAARKLVLEGRDQARQALAELRDLVRGIAPAILLDRGLVAALSSIAGRSPVPTVVVSELAAGERLPDAVERAAYFVVAEALANVAKHSSAMRCEVRCRREADRLVVEIWDDGAGGAQTCPGGGLAGLIGRVQALDGTLTVSSPAGGPTLLRAELPVSTWRASSLPQAAPRRAL